MHKISLISLGCSKNLVDSETMLAALQAAGFAPTDDPAGADVVIINTCGFIEAAKREAIEQILAVIDLKNQGLIRGIVVAGCLSQRYRDQIAAEFPEVDAFVGTTSQRHIVTAVRSALAGTPLCAFDGENDPPFFGDRLQSTPFYTAYLKIAEGCNNRCAYCAIPLIRGPLRSLDADALTRQAKTLAKNGVRELCVIAQDTTAYGMDRSGKPELTALLGRLCAVEGLDWIRLLYCYPDKIDENLLQFIKANDKILKYLDIPIQHVDQNLLRAMRRPGDYDSLLRLVGRIRAILPDATLRTTVIVGFPGETDAQFETLCRFIQEARFDKLGAFTFSPEEGTPAADLPDQLDEDTKQQRLETLMELQRTISQSKLEEKLGKTLTVLVEGYDEESECYFGRSMHDAPEIDGRVLFQSIGDQTIQPGTLVRARIRHALDYDLIGEQIS